MGEPQTTGQTSAARDPIRDQLLDAAVRVFARNGFTGTKILDIVREAGVSTGAVYGRFASKEDLLREAVVSRTRMSFQHQGETGRVADLIARRASSTDGALTDDEAVRLEAYVTARREPEIAAALTEAQKQWRGALQPVIDAALADGSVAPDIDPEAVVYLVSTLRMGLLVQRAAGFPSPDDESWDALVRTIVSSFGADRPQAPERTP